MENLENKTKEKLLQESEEKYRGLYNSIRDSILVADTNRNIIDCNPAFSSLFGYSKDEIIGKQTVYIYENETEFKALGEALKEHFGDSPFLKTVNYKKKSGEIFPGETNVFYLKDDKGEISGFIGLIRDITKRKLSEKTLKYSEEKFRKAFHTSPDSININRLSDGLYVEINKGFTKIMGYTEDEVIGETSTELNIWANSSDRNKLVAGLQANGFVENLEAKFCAKSGELKVGLLSATVIELNGEPHILSIVRDITERKQAEVELAKHREHLEELVKVRTLEVEEKNQKLSDQIKIFVGRELKIRDLENKIKVLQVK